MTQHRADIDDLVAEILGEHLERFRGDFERMRQELGGFIDATVAAKPLPPFVPPAAWAAGRHSGGCVVRHRNGLFFARRDTNDEPPTDAWLPLLVGIAGVAFEWPDDRTMVLRVELSDGEVVESERDFVVPIARGFWKAEETYREGDRVLRFGDWQAALPSTGIDPNSAANDGHWIKVTGKQHRAVSFKLDDDGTLYESGQAIGSIKPLVAELLGDLVRSHA
jgi:hypothetical protein